MNSTALPSRYFGTHRQCFAAFILTWLAYSDGIGNVKIALSEKIALLLHRHTFRAVWLLHNLTLDGKLCLRDGKNAAFV